MFSKSVGIFLYSMALFSRETFITFSCKRDNIITTVIHNNIIIIHAFYSHTYTLTHSHTHTHTHTHTRYLSSIRSENSNLLAVHLIADQPAAQTDHHFSLVFIALAAVTLCLILAIIRPPEEVLPHTLWFLMPFCSLKKITLLSST